MFVRRPTLWYSPSAGRSGVAGRAGAVTWRGLIETHCPGGAANVLGPMPSAMRRTTLEVVARVRVFIGASCLPRSSLLACGHVSRRPMTDHVRIPKRHPVGIRAPQGPVEERSLK